MDDNRKSTTLRFPPALLKWITAQAKAQRISINRFVSGVLESARRGIVLDLPPDQLKELQARAARECRTPEQQAAYLIAKSLQDDQK